jgi:hypothetical protein
MIIVFAPDLEALLSEVERPPRLLSRLLTRSSQRELAGAGFFADLVTGRAVAPAAIARRYLRPDDHAGAWAFADPLRLQPDLNAVWIQPHAFRDDQEPVLADLRELLREEGLDFELTEPGRGFLRLAEAPGAEFTPPWAIAGQSMEKVLPRGPRAALWTRRLNDCQVLLHHHARDDGSVPSGLWFWGAGSLPDQRPAARISHLIGDGDGLRELADWLELSHSPAESGVPDGTLYRWAPAPEDSADRAIVALSELLRPLWQRLALGRIDALELASRRVVYRVRPVDVWRFWVR